MIKNGMRPVHPGEILFEEFMKPAEPPIKVARQSATKMLKEIGGLLVDTSSWESRLRAANVPQAMLAAVSETSATWHKTFSDLRMELERVLIDAVNNGNPLLLQEALTKASNLTQQYRAESVTTKRLMAPAPKSRGKKSEGGQ